MPEDPHCFPKDQNPLSSLFVMVPRHQKNVVKSTRRKDSTVGLRETECLFMRCCLLEAKLNLVF